jgi:hypothetical protein
MNLQHSGRIIVRVTRPHFQALMAAPSAALAMSATGATRPLFGTRHSIGPTFNLRAAAADQHDWLLHTPDRDETHPWDKAHQVAQGKSPGSAQFVSGDPVYAEPDLVMSRQFPAAPRAATASASAAGPAGDPIQSQTVLNTNFGPTPPKVFSPAWHLEQDYANFFAAWKFNTGAGIRIAHLDTGYTPGHSSTPRNIRPQEGFNFPGNNTDTVDPGLSAPWDMPGHGTATLALLAGNHIDIEYQAGPIYNGDIGGAPDATVIPVIIGASVIHIYDADMAQGLDYALAPRGTGAMCDVVSLSHGGLPSSVWADAVNRLYDAGVVVVAAAGDSIYLEVIDVATHFTVYPAAFYRVVTATGTTFDKGPYITNNFAVLQGCWGPDAVMKKAIAAYTPNVPWMNYKVLPSGWDVDGGGTSSSAPQIAAACALWLKQHGSLFPSGWQRVEACRHALFVSAKQRGENLSEIGVGLLDAAAMLSAETLTEVQRAYSAGELRYVAADSVSFPFFRLLFGLAPPGPGVDEMYETEAAQIFYRSANAELAKAVEANPDGAPAQAPDAATAKRLRDAFIAEPSMSDTLRTYLKAKAAAMP